MVVVTSDGNESGSSTSSSIQWSSQQCRHFEFSEILLATENFNESLVIGRGGFGKVYRATIYNGSTPGVAAIKRSDPNSSQGAPEFWAEVEMLSKFRHCNLVSLFGYCNHEKEMILVYEYMPNGTLEDHLHKLGTPLSWLQRLKICIGAGRGLHYLHTGTGLEVGVIHRDFKTSNILLHETWAAKISDFGLSKVGPTNQPSTCVSTLVKGTFGYFDPDYYATGKLTRKSDVYAFGVVLLEVLCRKRAVFDINDQTLNLANWAQESIKEGNLKHIIDSDLRGQISSKCIKEFVRIAKRCLHSYPKPRSTMAEVLSSLESILILQEKYNNSVQLAGTTIYGRMVNMLPFQTTEFKQDTDSGKKCYMLGARELSITWQDDTRYWKWGHVPKSRFAEVAILKRVCWLDIRGKISSAILSPRSIYVAYLVFQMAPNSTGLSVPAKTVLTFGGKKNEISNVHLQKESTLTRVSHTKRKDGWMEIKLGEFYHHDEDEGEVEMMFLEHETLNWKTGLIVEGIEIRPI